MIDQFYRLTTDATLDLREFGKREFDCTAGTPQGYLGVAIQDTSTLLVGMQNILAIHLGMDVLKLDVGNLQHPDKNNDWLSAMKAVHRYFFIAIQSSLEAAAERICGTYGFGEHKGEKAYRKALTKLPKSGSRHWEQYYEALKVLRNECAHSSTGDIHPGQRQLLQSAGLGFLLSGTTISVNCSKYKPVSELAQQCIRDIEAAAHAPSRNS